MTIGRARAATGGGGVSSRCLRASGMLMLLLVEGWIELFHIRVGDDLAMSRSFRRHRDASGCRRAAATVS